MSNTSALWYFESVNLYDILCPHKVKPMAERHTFNYFKKDQFIYFPDEPAQYIYMVADGRVRIGHYTDDGKEVVTAILGMGEIFGELSLAVEEKRRDFAQAIVDKKTIGPFSMEDLNQLIN